MQCLPVLCVCIYGCPVAHGICVCVIVLQGCAVFLRDAMSSASGFSVGRWWLYFQSFWWPIINVDWTNGPPCVSVNFHYKRDKHEVVFLNSLTLVNQIS